MSGVSGGVVLTTDLIAGQSTEEVRERAQSRVERQNRSLYQINTRVSLCDLFQKRGRAATLDDFPDSELDRLADRGFDWLWFLGMWQTGAAARKISRQSPEWLVEFRQVLPDLQPDDISGSCFAVTGYTAHSDFGGDAALDRLRHRIHQRGMRLVLDFVPNHTAPDHPWVKQHPEFYIAGTEEKLRSEPQNYVRLDGRVLAYGRDPYFPGWLDTLQLNYAQPGLQEAMRRELQSVAARCDGVRCDMAMLILPDVFKRTWGLDIQPFWPLTLQSIHSKKPDFLFMAEVYWDLEWTLQQQGFDFTYDKRLYDRLLDQHARPVREHFYADKDFQEKSVRFLENHDEPRAASTFPPNIHRAAAVLTFLCPGLRFFHDGQFEGRTKKISPHLGRRPAEPVDSALSDFYSRLCNCVHLPETREGEWRLLEAKTAWDGNWTWDCFIIFAWQKPGNSPLLVVVNYAPNQSQCSVRLPFEQIRGQKVRLRDLMGSAIYQRDGNDLLSHGLYLDLPAWGYHVFRVETV